jgi:putative Mg2+ transporter-C (MgtC) family protein
LISPDVFREVVLRLGAAVLAGSAIGLDREVRRRPAGLRTHALVSLGAALLVVIIVPLSSRAALPSDTLSRVIQGIIVGVGFLGGGTILKNEHGSETVHGLTTAATIWVTAALGVACGAGLWAPAIVAGLLAILIVTVGRPVERLVHYIFKDPKPEPKPENGPRTTTGDDRAPRW